MRKTVEIQATEILPLRNGRAISITKSSGEIQDGIAKDGSPRVLSYASGSPILHDDKGNVVCGPIDFAGAKGFALDIVSGDHRAATEPGASLRLATALLTLMNMIEFMDGPEFDDPAQPAEVA